MWNVTLSVYLKCLYKAAPVTAQTGQWVDETCEKRDTRSVSADAQADVRHLSSHLS